MNALEVVASVLNRGGSRWRAEYSRQVQLSDKSEVGKSTYLPSAFGHSKDSILCRQNNLMEVWGRALQPERIRTGPPGTGCYLLL